MSKSYARPSQKYIKKMINKAKVVEQRQNEVLQLNGAHELEVVKVRR